MSYSRSSLPLPHFLLFSVLFLWGCLNPTAPRTASFRQRPDSVHPGSLEGPFTGRVVAAGTGRPIRDALVYATWSYLTGYGLAREHAYQDFHGTTTVDGYYYIPQVTDIANRKRLPQGARLTDFRLLIYKRGYAAYRSDRKFSNGKQRFDFVQRHNKVRLQLWNTRASHTEHLSYLGSAPSLRTAIAWERTQASSQQTSPNNPVPRISPTRAFSKEQITAATLLDEDTIKEITGYKGTFQIGPLADTPNTEHYSSQHFKATDQEASEESYDLAIRMWKLKREQANTHYDQLLSNLGKPQQPNTIATRSFHVTEQGILGVGFWDEPRGLVVLLSCGAKQCAHLDIATKIAQSIHDKVSKSWPLLTSPDPQ